MTLLERIEYFVEAAQSQEDLRTAEEVINEMTPYDLLARLDDAFRAAGITFNKDW